MLLLLAFVITYGMLETSCPADVFCNTYDIRVGSGQLMQCVLVGLILLTVRVAAFKNSQRRIRQRPLL